MENKVINTSYHRHRLILKENGVSGNKPPHDCYGCGDPVTNLEAAYTCTKKYCRDRPILHRSCGELPREISHPKHPQHPIPLFDYHGDFGNPWCDICLRDIGKELAYKCSSCNFDVDIRCAKLLQGQRQLQHPSHPDHPLTLMRKPAFPFCCDGCGVEDVDMAYICSTCEFWIHKSCASLPLILPKNLQCHHHDLSLAFSFPMEYHKYIHYCDLCHKKLSKACWVYFCGDCRFFAHLRCATSPTQTTKRDSNLNKDDNGGFQLSLHDISKELITPFVMRERGLNKIPDADDLPKIVNLPTTTASFSFLFNYHKHSLSLVSEFHEDEEDHQKIMDDEEKDEAADVELKICDVCVTPIFSPPYYQCADCKYFVHSICYLLPKTLSSSSSSSSHLFGDCRKTHNKNHKFTLYTSSEAIDRGDDDRSFHLYRCEFCRFPTNGMVYECENCKMKIDVKCMSLPTNIKHASHSYHKGLSMTRTSLEKGGRRNTCETCGDTFYSRIGYRCNNDDCDFALDLKCAMLPLSITNHEWDNHPLSLTFDASLDHPSDFICEKCEEEINPKKWMYHCRQCDHSYHLRCIKTASGWYRNIKFGQRFVLDGIHPHPLTFNCVTLKKRCDICHELAYDNCGLECASCYYVVCLDCGHKELAKKM